MVKIGPISIGITEFLVGGVALAGLAAFSAAGGFGAIGEGACRAACCVRKPLECLRSIFTGENVCPECGGGGGVTECKCQGACEIPRLVGDVCTCAECKNPDGSCGTLDQAGNCVVTSCKCEPGYLPSRTADGGCSCTKCQATEPCTASLTPTGECLISCPTDACKDQVCLPNSHCITLSSGLPSCICNDGFVEGPTPGSGCIPKGGTSTVRADLTGITALARNNFEASVRTEYVGKETCDNCLTVRIECNSPECPTESSPRGVGLGRSSSYLRYLDWPFNNEALEGTACIRNYPEGTDIECMSFRVSR